MLMAFNMTIPGVPVIYYGDEFGMPGGNDPDSRRMMRFEGLNEIEIKNLEITKKLLALRNSSMALTYGDFYTLQVDDKSYVFLRKYFEEVQIVFFNKDENTKTFEIELPEWMDADELEANFGSSFEIKKNKVTLTLEPWSFEILSGNDN
jgi:glycosidase